MIARILAKVFGTANDRKLRQLRPLVEQIIAHEPRVLQLTNEQLAAKTNEFREKLSQGATLDDILPEAFAVVRETGKRQLGQRHFDVQLMGGVVLHQGKIAEMKTGEGKTLTATLPLYLNALAGKGSHLVTVNDYLARRDAEWMGSIYKALGLSVGCIQNWMSDSERKATYECDVLYATNNELGFDYLRDNMKFRLEDYVQRGLSYAIVDEVDSILIDEARTPLIISGSAEESSKLYVEANNVIKHMKKDVDFEVDEKMRTSQLTESAIDKAESAFGVKNLYSIENLKLLHHINQALRAHALFKRDVDYVVKDDQVLIVDEFTGRILPGRRYSDGLHQALEAKEGATIERESQTLASITLQNYFRLYKKLAGMTGTAATEAEEFWKIYKLDVVSIPTNQKVIRQDKDDLIFLTKPAKYNAIVADVRERHERGQPVLIGTISIETSELLSDILTANGVPHDVLNAKHHAREAEIVAHAGEAGRVTIATNMAGRGTDIKLIPEARAAGGLYILGTERHESRRIDNQLRGRSGRQGDPGESRFYISLEDELIRIFAGDNLKKNMHRVGMKEDEVIESKLISRIIENAQERVEKQNFEYRKHLIEYDDVLNQQRMVVYRYRRHALEGADNILVIVRDQIGLVVEHIFATHDPKNVLNPDMLNEILAPISRLVNMTIPEIKNQKISTTNLETLRSDLVDFLLLRYELATPAPTSEIPDNKSALVHEAQKWVVLEAIDQAWKQHMLNLDHLKEGIGLRSWGQKNPLLEYKREAFTMFEDMMHGTGYEIVHNIFHLNLEHFDSHELEHKREREMEQMNLQGAGSSVDADAESKQERIGRNEACPCGSGKKYKKCCGK
jgi:preprotein translocase subunit SecA